MRFAVKLQASENGKSVLMYEEQNLWNIFSDLDGYFQNLIRRIGKCVIVLKSSFKIELIWKTICIVTCLVSTLRCNFATIGICHASGVGEREHGVKTYRCFSWKVVMKRVFFQVARHGWQNTLIEFNSYGVTLTWILIDSTAIVRCDKQ